MNPQPAQSSRDTALDVVRQLQRAGFAAFWVGGCVRDFLLAGSRKIMTSPPPPCRSKSSNYSNVRSRSDANSG